MIVVLRLNIIAQLRLNIVPQGLHLAGDLFNAPLKSALLAQRLFEFIQLQFPVYFSLDFGDHPSGFTQPSNPVVRASPGIRSGPTTMSATTPIIANSQKLISNMAGRIPVQTLCQTFKLCRSLDNGSCAAAVVSLSLRCCAVGWFKLFPDALVFFSGFRIGFSAFFHRVAEAANRGTQIGTEIAQSAAAEQHQNNAQNQQ
jgi:hypothetical protein